jgi:uncharacterized protein
MYRYFAILKEYSKSEEDFEIVMRHSLEVLGKSIEIVGKKKLYSKVDLDLIVSGALLHDIGTFGFLENKDKEGYIRHGIIGGEILRGLGMEKEARIAERHIGSGLTKEEIIAKDWDIPHEDFLPESLEEKILCYADKFSSKNPDKKDTPEMILKEFEDYGEEPLRRFLELKEMFG